MSTRTCGEFFLGFCGKGRRKRGESEKKPIEGRGYRSMDPDEAEKGGTRTHTQKKQVGR